MSQTFFDGLKGLRSVEETGPGYLSDRGLGQISVRLKESVGVNPFNRVEDLHLACLKLSIKLVISVL